MLTGSVVRERANLTSCSVCKRHLPFHTHALCSRPAPDCPRYSSDYRILLMRPSQNLWGAALGAHRPTSQMGSQRKLRHRKGSDWLRMTLFTYTKNRGFLNLWGSGGRALSSRSSSHFCYRTQEVRCLRRSAQELEVLGSFIHLQQRRRDSHPKLWLREGRRSHGLHTLFGRLHVKFFFAVGYTYLAGFLSGSPCV